jgi:hypothetical protein
MSAGGTVTRGEDGEFRGWGYEALNQAKQDGIRQALSESARARRLLGDEGWEIWKAALPKRTYYSNELFSKAVRELLKELEGGGEAGR